MAYTTSHRATGMMGHSCSVLTTSSSSTGTSAVATLKRPLLRGARADDATVKCCVPLSAGAVSMNGRPLTAASTLRMQAAGRIPPMDACPGPPGGSLIGTLCRGAA